MRPHSQGDNRHSSSLQSSPFLSQEKAGEHEILGILHGYPAWQWLLHLANWKDPPLEKWENPRTFYGDFDDIIMPPNVHINDISHPMCLEMSSLLQFRWSQGIARWMICHQWIKWVPYIHTKPFFLSDWVAERTWPALFQDGQMAAQVIPCQPMCTFFSGSNIDKLPNFIRKGARIINGKVFFSSWKGYKFHQSCEYSCRSGRNWEAFGISRKKTPRQLCLIFLTAAKQHII